MSVTVSGANDSTILVPKYGYVKSNVGLRDNEAKQVGTLHMAENPGVFEPLRTNHFEFQVSGLANKIKKRSNTLFPLNNTYDNIEDVIRLSTDAFGVPHFTQNALQITRGNSTINFAGKANFQAQTLRVHDYVGEATKEALMAWQQLSFDVETEKVGLAVDYKLPCAIREYTPDGITVREWTLYGCWISGISESGFDLSNEQLAQISATITYDRAVLKLDEEIKILT